MPEAVKELLHVASPVTISVDGANEESLSVKGFASVHTKDRSGDLVPPTEFLIDRFMAAPSLLVNHRLWNDDNGNRVAAGHPTEMYAAKLANIDGDDDNFAIIDLVTKKQVNVYPKAKVPQLKNGDRGLFVVVEVTQPDVVQMVKQGELTAFSWRGLTEVEYTINPKTGVSQRVFKNIDLYEISLVNVPDNPDSTFMVGKAAHMMKLSKSRFETRDQAVAYLESHDLSTDLREDEDAFYSRQIGPNRVDLTQLVVMKMSDGVDAIVGTLKEPQSWEARVLNEYDKIATLFDPPLTEASKSEETAMADATDARASEESQSTAAETTEAEKTPKDEGKQDDTEKKETEKASECGPGQVKDDDGKCVESKEAKALDALSSNIAEKTAAAFMDGMKPYFEGLTASMKSLGDGMTTIVKKMTPEDDESTETDEDGSTKEVAKSAEVFSQLNTMAETLTNLQTQLVEVAKSAQQAETTAKAVAKSTPDETERKETIEAEKSADEGDENSCFDSVFPFLGSAAAG